MIESLATAACGFNGDGDIFLNALLANVFGERFGAHAGVKARVVVKRSAADDALGSMSIASCHCFFLTEFSHIFCWLTCYCNSRPIHLHYRDGVLSAYRV